MITPTWQSYFIFSKKELKGIVVLGFILAGSVFLSLFFTHPKSTDLSVNTRKTFHLVNFDPNTIDSIHAIALGIPEKQVRTLMHYRERGGYFKTIESFAKLYGLKNDLFMQLSPYVKISNVHGNIHEFYANKYKSDKQKSKVLSWKLDINNSDENEWKLKTHLPLIFIKRVIAYRQYKGAYTSLYEIKKVYGFPDSLFLALKPHLYISTGSNLLVNANSMSFDDWKKTGLFTERQIWMILKLKKEHNGKIEWVSVVEICDLSQVEAQRLKQKVHFTN